MDETLRAELDRIHADLAALRLIVSRLAARHFDEAEIERWTESCIAQAEAQPGADPQVTANLTRALHKLAVHLREAARNYRGRRSPD